MQTERRAEDATLEKHNGKEDTRLRRQGRGPSKHRGLQEGGHPPEQKHVQTRTHVLTRTPPHRADTRTNMPYARGCRHMCVPTPTRGSLLVADRTGNSRHHMFKKFTVKGQSVVVEL